MMGINICTRSVFSVNNKLVLWVLQCLMRFIKLIHKIIPYLLLGEQLCVHHLDLDRNQSKGLKCKTPSISVVVLNKKANKQKFTDALTKHTKKKKLDAIFPSILWV